MKLRNLFIVLALLPAISQVMAQKVIRGTNTDVKYANTTVVYKDSTATDKSVLTQLDNEPLGVGDVVRITTPPPKPKPAPTVPAPVANPVVRAEVHPPVAAPVSIGYTIGVPVAAPDNQAAAPANKPARLAERAADPVPVPVAGAKFDLVASSDPAVFLNTPNDILINNINYVPNQVVSPNIGSRNVNDYAVSTINHIPEVPHPAVGEAPAAVAAPATVRHTNSGSAAHAGGRSGLKRQGWSLNLFGSKSYHKRGVQRYNCYRFK